MLFWPRFFKHIWKIKIKWHFAKMIGLNNLVPRVLSYWLRVGENPWNEVVDWIVVWLDWISLHKSQTACPRGSTGILDYSLRKICEIVRFALRVAIWLGAIIWRTVFQYWRLVKKCSSIDPEAPEKAIISVFKSYLVHLGSFKRHILYFCASIIEKIRSHWGEPYDAKFVNQCSYKRMKCGLSCGHLAFISVY